MNKGYISLTEEKNESDTNVIKIIHISDTHGRDYDHLIPGGI